MSLNKGELRTRTLQLADAIDSSRWDDSANGEVDLHISAVFDREWRRILNAATYYHVNRVTVTSDANGYYDLDDLTTGSGDTAKRFYRVIAFSKDDVIYEETRIDQFLLPNITSPQPQWIWYFEGNAILALPLATTTDALIIVNYLPPRPTSLSDDTVEVDFPNGYEDVIAWSAASRLLNKSGSEAGRAQVCELQAEALREDMLQDLMRRSLAPVRMRYNDSVWDYGG